MGRVFALQDGEGRSRIGIAANFDLSGYCREVVKDRVVDEGDIVTAGGVASSIDLGLHLVNRFAGEDACGRIAEQMAYSKV